MLTGGQIFTAPAGASVDDLEQWEPIDCATPDGIAFDETAEWDAKLWRLANPPIHQSFTVRFAGKKSHRRAIAKLFTGRHRLPGDRPLIHKGKKAK